MEQLVLNLVVDSARVGLTIQALRSLRRPLVSVADFMCAHVLVDAEDPCHLCYVEEWGTADRLREDLRTERFGRLLSIMESATRPPSLEFRTVSGARGLEVVEQARGGVTDVESNGGARGKHGTVR